MATPLVPQLLLCALMGTMGAANILYEAVLGVALADKGGSVLHWLAEQVRPCSHRKALQGFACHAATRLDPHLPIRPILRSLELATQAYVWL